MMKMCNKARHLFSTSSLRTWCTLEGLEWKGDNYMHLWSNLVNISQDQMSCQVVFNKTVIKAILMVYLLSVLLCCLLSSFWELLPFLVSCAALEVSAKNGIIPARTSQKITLTAYPSRRVSYKFNLSYELLSMFGMFTWISNRQLWSYHQLFERWG